MKLWNSLETLRASDLNNNFLEIASGTLSGAAAPDQTLYVNPVTAWNGASVTLVAIYEQLY